MTSETEFSELRPLAGDRPPWRVDRSKYMAEGYLLMAGAVMVSAAAALAADNVLLAGLLFTANGLTVTGWIVTFAPLILVIILGTGVDRLSVGTAHCSSSMRSSPVYRSVASCLPIREEVSPMLSRQRQWRSPG